MDAIARRNKHSQEMQEVGGPAPLNAVEPAGPFCALDAWPQQGPGRLPANDLAAA
jgi:hypothetical protein